MVINRAEPGQDRPADLLIFCVNYLGFPRFRVDAHMYEFTGP
jgi:hypothetical protein